MKGGTRLIRHSSLLFSVIIAAVTLLSSCGARSGYFKIEGRFLHINQGDLYVYSPDGAIEGMDTIHIKAGRFAYETPMQKSATLIMVFPNFSEHPIFTEPGAAVDVEADASRLKEMTVTGTKENKLMNKFREMTVGVSPVEEAKLAETFVRDHADSRVALYLVKKYFVQSTPANYAKATELLTLLQQANPEDGRLSYQLESVRRLAAVRVGGRLPRFSVTDIDGNTVSDSYLSKGKAVLMVWASWNFESMDLQRRLRDYRRDHGDSLRVLSLSLDGSRESCRRAMKANNIDWPTVCDQQLMDGKLVQLLGVGTVPDNIVLENGKVVARGLDRQKFMQRFK